MPDDPESYPGTEPFAPDFDTGRHAGSESDPFASDFDTGAHSRPLTEPFVPDFDTDSRSSASGQAEELSEPDRSPQLKEQPGSSSQIPEADSEDAQAPPIEQVAAPVQSVTVPGRYCYLKWWKLILVVIGVWIAAAAIGPGLFYWWTQDRSVYKTPVVFVVLIYVVMCTVGGLLLAMVEGRPLVAALAIAVMSAPFASVAATAPFYGAFYCSHMADACFIGIVPF